MHLIGVNRQIGLDPGYGFAPFNCYSVFHSSVVWFCPMVQLQLLVRSAIAAGARISRGLTMMVIMVVVLLFGPSSSVLLLNFSPLP